nr:N4-gp56 family major capsid protein [Oscillospiraceae bacterium]MBQ8243602.1 N4-gp56 family major capsid protein [Oscillospiraceae bacterium]
MDKFINMDLQLFAEVQTTTAEGLSAEMKTFYDMTLIDEASANLVHDQFGQKRSVPANGGKVIEFRKFAALDKALTPLTEGVTPAGQRMEVSTVTAELSQYGDYITQTDMLELTALDNTILEATKLLGRQAGLTLDTVVRNILQSGTNVTYCPKVENGVETPITSRKDLGKNCQLTVDVVHQVVAKLRAQNAPTIGGKYVAIIHPYVAYDLMRDPEWIASHQYADPKSIFEGEIGELGGVRFVQTTEAKVYEGGIFGSLFLGDGAYGVSELAGGGLQTIVKQKGSAGSADPLDQRSSVGWKAVKTAEILIPAYMVRVESYSNRFSGTVQEN